MNNEKKVIHAGDLVVVWEGTPLEYVATVTGRRDLGYEVENTKTRRREKVRGGAVTLLLQN